MIPIKMIGLPLGLLGLAACPAALAAPSVTEMAVSKTEPKTAKARLFVLTDIEADPDDAQSLIRLLLYANDIDIVGLAAITSAPQPDRVAPDSIRKIIREYAKVRPNLLLHSPEYPGEERLLAIVSEGLPVYGLRGVGKGKDSPASRALVRELLSADPRPLWVSIWGGSSVLAQALYEIRSTTSVGTAQRAIRKLRAYAISDQDDSGPWIRKNFQSVFYIVTPWSWDRATWFGMAYRLPHSNLDVVSNKWIAENIQQGHGPLGAAYPDVAYGMEGDTPSFLNLIPNGLSDPEHPNWGGWGGRYELYTPKLPSVLSKAGIGLNEPETRPIWTNAEDYFAPSTSEPAPPGMPGLPHPNSAAFEVRDNYVTIWRWRPAYQNDFAARMAWSIRSYKEANHAPIVKVATGSTLIVKSGQTFDLDCSISTDPDGDSLSFYWFQYREAGSYDGVIPLGPSPTLSALRGLKAPLVTKTETAHIIVAVTDKGTPPLTRYQRVIVTIVPR